MSIIVGFVPTPEGEAALDQAILEAISRSKRLVIVNSSRGEAYVDQSYVHSTQAATLTARLAATGIEYELTQPVRGHDAAEEVLRVATTSRAELIVIGLRKRSAVGKLILGSTAQTILLQAACPVLAVKAAS